MRRMLAAIAATIITITLAPAVAQASETPPIRVLPLGDSVTHGLDGEHTWRYYAWQMLDGSGADFVGPFTGTAGAGDDYYGGGYADPNFDQDHASRYGMSMTAALYYHWLDDNPGIMGSNPDVVVMGLGINDLTYWNQSVEDAIAHVRALITKFRASHPDVDFALLSLPQVWYERVPAYNALLPGGGCGPVDC